MTVAVTVDFDGHNKEAARRALEAAGFKVVRVATKRETAFVTPVDPNRRASAVTDMPEGLDEHEQRAYVRGYAKGAMTWAKTHVVGGGDTPAPDRPDTEDAEQLAAWRQVYSQWLEAEWASVKAHTKVDEWERHPSCHRAAMKALGDWQGHWAAYTASIAPAAPALRVVA